MLDTIRSFTFHIPTKIEYGLDKFYEIGKLLICPNYWALEALKQATKCSVPVPISLSD